MKIIAGTAHPALANEIAKCLGMEITKATINKFPDGEIFAKIDENIRQENVFIIQPTCPPTNENLMELFIIIDAVKRASAKTITAVMPFFGYARQDRKSEPRVPITAKLVADLLETAGINRLLTIDLHAQQIQGFFNVPVDHLYAAPVLIDYIKKDFNENLIVVSPDVGGMKMTHAYAQYLGVDMAIVAKRRLSATKVEAVELIGNVKGKDVLLVDDLTETAGTLTAAADFLKKNGAKSISAGVSHAVLDDRGQEKLNNSIIKNLISTNSTPYAKGKKVTCLSIAPLLAEAMHRIFIGKSITSLFKINF